MIPSMPVLETISQPFKRSQLGLFHGKTKQYGNNVPFSKHKTRRTWLPNVQQKRIFSEALESNVRVKVTTRAMRTIKKHGGLDNYVKNTRADLLGWEGMRLRVQVKEKEHEKREEVKKERYELFLKTPEGKVKAKRKSEAQAKEEKARILRLAMPHKQPSMSQAEQARREAGKALGLDTLASAQQTIEFLKQKRIELGRNVKL